MTEAAPIPSAATSSNSSIVRKGWLGCTGLLGLLGAVGFLSEVLPRVGLGVSLLLTAASVLYLSVTPLRRSFGRAVRIQPSEHGVLLAAGLLIVGLLGVAGTFDEIAKQNAAATEAKLQRRERRNAERRLRLAREVNSSAYPQALAAARQNNWAEASRRFEQVLAVTNGVPEMNAERMRALFGKATAEARLGDRAGATLGYEQFIRAAVGVDWQPVMQKMTAEVPSFVNASSVETFDTAAENVNEQAKAEAERREQVRAAEQARREAAADREVQAEFSRRAREIAPQIQQTARRYVEHEWGSSFEFTSVGEPYMNTGRWAVQVQGVADDYRGRRAKIIVVYFSPLNFEVVDSREIL